jgi:hypothetical protein
MTLLRRSVLQIEDRLSDLPRLITAKLTVPSALVKEGLVPRGAKLGLAMRPHSRQALLVLEQRDGLSAVCAANLPAMRSTLLGDALSWPTADTARTKAAKALQSLGSTRKLPKSREPLYRGQWSGHLELHRDGDQLVPRVVLRRSVSSYGKLFVESTPDGWSWRFERKDTWFAEAAELGGTGFPSLFDAVTAGMAGLIPSVQNACGSRDVMRRAAVDADYAAKRPLPAGKPIRDLLSGFGQLGRSKKRKAKAVEVPVDTSGHPETAQANQAKVQAAAAVAKEIPQSARDARADARVVLTVHERWTKAGNTDAAKILEDYAAGSLEPVDREISLEELRGRLLKAGEGAPFWSEVNQAIAALKGTPWCLRRLHSLLGRLENHLASAPCGQERRALTRASLDRAWMEWDLARDAWISDGDQACTGPTRRSARQASEAAERLLQGCKPATKTSTGPLAKGDTVYIGRAGLKALAADRVHGVVDMVGVGATLVSVPKKKAGGVAKIRLAGRVYPVAWKYLSRTPPTASSQRTLRRQLTEAQALNDAVYRAMDHLDEAVDHGLSDTVVGARAEALSQALQQATATIDSATRRVALGKIERATPGKPAPKRKSTRKRAAPKRAAPKRAAPKTDAERDQVLMDAVTAQMRLALGVE